MRKLASSAATMLIALCATACVVATETPAPPTPLGQNVPLTVRIDIASAAASSRATEQPGSTAPGTISVSNGHIFILHPTDVVIDAAPLDVAAASGLGGQPFPVDIPTYSRVFIVANIPPDAPPMNYLRTLSEIKAAGGAITTQTDYTRTTLANTGGEPAPMTIEGPVDLRATATVSLAPVVSRLEIGPIRGTGDIRGFTVTGVYLDNYTTSFTFGATAKGSPLSQPAGGLYAVGDDGEWVARPSGDAWSAAPDDGQVWAYNVASGTPPGLVVRLDNVDVGGTILPQPQLLRVERFTGLGDSPALRPGVIYRTGEITFSEEAGALSSNLFPIYTDTPVYSVIEDAEWFALSPRVPRVKVIARSPGGAAASGTVRLSVHPDRLRGWEEATGRFSSELLAPVFEESRNVTVAAGGSAQVAFDVPLPAPGFYRCRVIADDGTILHSFNIGCDPEQIVSPRDAQPDFEEFWQRARAELDAVAPRYQFTYLSDVSNDNRKVYVVSMYSLGGVQIQGYYACPTKEGPHPAIITYLGYGSSGSVLNPNSNPDYVELQLSTRGQGINRTENIYGEWAAHGIEDKENYYYRGAFMDLVRGVDFLVSRPEVDSRFIFAEGGSQGGAFTLAAAALDHRITAAAPTVPFLSDYPDYFKISPFLANKIMPRARSLGVPDEQTYRTLSYFDIKNLAGWITCPVLMGIGLQDETCPPHTNFAGYNLITAPKQYHCYPQNAHSVGGTWASLRKEFFNTIRSTP